MAILKYTTADGTVVKLNSYKVNNLVPVQSKGDNPNAVMSQKATTDELNAIGLQIDEATGKITALTSTVNGKAEKSEVNVVKAVADKAAADITDINTDLTEIHNTLGECATTDDLGELENIVSGKANKTDLTNEVNRAKAAEKSNADNITSLDSRVEALEGNVTIDCGEY